MEGEVASIQAVENGRNRGPRAAIYLSAIGGPT